MTDLNAVDVSQWGGPLSNPEAQAMVAQGVTTIIVGSGPGGYGKNAAQQARTAALAGMRVEAYTYLEFGSDPAWWAAQAVESLQNFVPARWWVDVEDNTNAPGLSVAQRIAYVQLCFDEFQRRGIFAHLYTGSWYWRPFMGDTDVFAKQGRKLWNSYYDGAADIDGLPYGGWTQADVAIEQYGGTTEVAGFSVDINHLYFTESEQQEEDMTKDETQALIDTAVAAAEARIKASYDRLNAVLVERFAIIEAASDPNAEHVDATYQQVVGGRP